MNFKELIQTKTFWTAFAGVVVAILGAMGKVNPDVAKAVDTICAFLAVIFVRDSLIAK